MRPEDSLAALEEMTGHAEKVLQLLGLPYRKIILCTGDMGFGACKAHDLEAWIPAQNTYREISPAPTFGISRHVVCRHAAAASRTRTRLVHTLNGSGLAVGRTLVAVDGKLSAGRWSYWSTGALCPYMNGLEILANTQFF
ncbi:aminoacyl--tRNA ligase-related protein [Shigella flexneri]